MQNPSSHFPWITLTFDSDPFKGKTYQSANKSFIKIGSTNADGQNNTLIITHNSIQPEHAYIVNDRGRVYIQIHDEHCRVMVNNRPVLKQQQQDLHDGDQLTLGEVVIFCDLSGRPTTSSLTGIWQTGSQSRVAASTRSLQKQQFQPAYNSPANQPSQALTEDIQKKQQQVIYNTAPSHQPIGNPNAHQSVDEVTRYMCAAVHTDEKFREYVLDDIFDKVVKAPGEAYGVDIVPVVRWAKAARTRTFIRDVFLLPGTFIACWLFGLVQNPLNALTSSFFYYLPIGFQEKVSPIVTAIFLRFPFFFTFYSIFILIALVFLAIKIDGYKGNVNWLLLVAFLPVVIYFPLIAVPLIIVIVERLWCYFGSEAQLLTRKKFRIDTGGKSLDTLEEQWLRDRFPQKDGNLVVYSGYSPFAGSGVKVGGWSFVVDVSRGKEAFGSQQLIAPQPFEVKDLYTEQAKSLDALKLENLDIKDKIYANGKELRSQSEGVLQNLLPDESEAPVNNVDQRFIDNFKERPVEDIRYYQCIQVKSWRNDLILSVFVRFYLSGRNEVVGTAKSLFVEGNYQLLTPVQERYREIDQLTNSFNIRRGLFVCKGIVAWRTFVIFLFPLIRILSSILRYFSPGRKEQQISNEIQDNPSFDYGAITSLREKVSSNQYQRYFQRLDNEMHVKLIEYQIFETLIQFLQDHNIDTRQLRERQETIINQGLMVTGGNFNAGAMNIGSKSTINMGEQSSNKSKGSE